MKKAGTIIAQIMAIVDVYDALTTERVYRRQLTPGAACAEIEDEARRGWRSSDLVGEFMAFYRSGRLEELAAEAAGPAAACSDVHVSPTTRRR